MNPSPQTDNIVAVQFKRRFESLGHGLYKREGVFYERPYINGRQTFRSLKATTERAARDELGANRLNYRRSKLGVTENPYSKDNAATVDTLLALYKKAGCPGRNGLPREGDKLDYELRLVENLSKFFGHKIARNISHSDLNDYHKWRIGRVKRGTGHRVVDLELVTLSNMFRYIVRNHGRQYGINANPISQDRQRWCQPDTVRHCRDVQPENGEELHALARYLFAEPRSEVLGWQLLFESMIGHRSHEIIRLRSDAKEPYQPGYIQKVKGAKLLAMPRQVEIGKTDLLYLFDSQTAKGTYPFVMIHKTLAELLRAHAAWLKQRWPKSPWFFPSPVNPQRPVGSSALTKALERITPAMGLEKRTSHGMRSYFVNVLRSHGVPDYEIALMIGQETGGKLIPSTYGKIPPHKLHWIPKEEKPAWIKWLGK